MRHVPDAGFWLAVTIAWERRTDEADQLASIGAALLLTMATIGAALLVGGTPASVLGCILAAVWPAVWVFGLWDEGRAILRHEGRPRR